MTGRYDSYFKAYDVRGKIPEVDERLFYLIGKGLIERVLRPQGLSTTVNVTYDVREKSELFSRYLTQGIADAGGSVVYLGLASTDFLYCSCVVNGNPGVQLTASHNPREYHGLKIVKKAPEMIGMHSGLADIRDYVNEHVEDEVPDLVELIGIDQSERQRVTEHFIAKAREVGSVESINQTMTQKNKSITVVADCSNGCAGVYMPWLRDLYPNVKIVPLYWEGDGSFPNHPSDVMELDNLKDLKQMILDQKADFGVAFDGDGDRIALLNEKGERVEGDFLCSAFTEAFLQEYYRNESWQQAYNPVIASIQPNSRCVWETIGANDGVGVQCKQGHTFVKDAMAKYNGLYGAEYSNHHYFGQLKGMDSGALPFTLIIKMYIEGGYATCSEMFEKWSDHYYITELINLEIPEGKTFEDWKQLLLKEFDDATISEYDGLAVYYHNWKFSMRSSNTEPVVRFILETRGRDLREEKVEKIKGVLGV